MIVPKLLVSIALTVFAVFIPATAKAQSATEWATNFKDHRDHARLTLRQTFEQVRTRAITHYKVTDPPRADFIRAMEVNISDLEDCVIVAKGQDRPNHTVTPIEKVTQQYIVRASQKASTLGQH